MEDKYRSTLFASPGRQITRYRYSLLLDLEGLGFR